MFRIFDRVKLYLTRTTFNAIKIRQLLRALKKPFYPNDGHCDENFNFDSCLEVDLLILAFSTKKNQTLLIVEIFFELNIDYN